MSNVAVGISLGTSSCLVAVSTAAPRIDIPVNEVGERSTPCVVGYSSHNNELLYAKDAKQLQIRMPLRVVPYLLPFFSGPARCDDFLTSLGAQCEYEEASIPDDADAPLSPTGPVSGQADSGSRHYVFPSADTQENGKMETVATPHTAEELLIAFLDRVYENVVLRAISNGPKMEITVSVPYYAPLLRVQQAVERSKLAQQAASIQVVYRAHAAAICALPSLFVPTGETGEMLAPLEAKEKQSPALQENLAQALRKPGRCGPTVICVVNWGAHILSVDLLVVKGGLICEQGWHAENSTCGGSKIDKVMATKLLQQFGKKHRMPSIADDIPARSRRKLLLVAEEKKMVLSSALTARVEVEALYEGMDLGDQISRLHLDLWMREDLSLHKKLSSLLEEVVHDFIEERLEDTLVISKVVAAGGVSRIPFIQQMLKENFAASSALMQGCAAAFPTNASDLEVLSYRLPCSEDELAASGACAISMWKQYATASESSASKAKVKEEGIPAKQGGDKKFDKKGSLGTRKENHPTSFPSIGDHKPKLLPCGSQQIHVAAQNIYQYIGTTASLTKAVRVAQVTSEGNEPVALQFPASDLRVVIPEGWPLPADAALATCPEELRIVYLFSLDPSADNSTREGGDDVVAVRPLHAEGIRPPAGTTAGRLVALPNHMNVFFLKGNKTLTVENLGSV